MPKSLRYGVSDRRHRPGLAQGGWDTKAVGRMASSHLDSPLTSLPLHVQREAEIYLLGSCIRTRQKMDGALLSGGSLLGWAPRAPKKYLTQTKKEAWAWVPCPPITS